MSPVNYRIIYKKIHPPEADALADSYGKAAHSVVQYTDEIEKIMAELDANWEGGQKERFMESFRPVSPKSREYAISTLQGI
jgi:uncharacterized protein YukE